MTEQTTSPQQKRRKRTINDIMVTLKANPVLLAIWSVLLLWIVASVVINFVSLAELIEAERAVGTDARAIIGGVVLSVGIVLVLSGAAFIGVLFMKRWARLLFGAFFIIAIAFFNIGNIIAGIIQLSMYLYLYNGYEKALQKSQDKVKTPTVTASDTKKKIVKKKELNLRKA